MQEAARLGGHAGAGLANATRSAYTDAMGTAPMVAAAVTVITIVVVCRALPRRDRERTTVLLAISYAIDPDGH